MYTPIDELIEEFRRTWMDFGMAESAPMYDPGRRYKRQDAEDSTEALKAAIERLQAENKRLTPTDWCDKHVATAGCPGCIEEEYRRLRAALRDVEALLAESPPSPVTALMRIRAALEGSK